MRLSPLFDFSYSSFFISMLSTFLEVLSGCHVADRRRLFTSLPTSFGIILDSNTTALGLMKREK